MPQKEHSHIAQKRSNGVKNKSKAKQNKSTSWLWEEIKSAFVKNSTNNPPSQFTQQQNIKQTNPTYIIINKEGTADNNCVSDTSKGRWKETMEYKRRGREGVGHWNDSREDNIFPKHIRRKRPPKSCNYSLSDGKNGQIIVLGSFGFDKDHNIFTVFLNFYKDILI